MTSAARGSQDEKARCGSRRVVRERGMEHVMLRSAGDRHNKPLQLTAFGAQDRSDCATIVCRAPSAAAEAQHVRCQEGAWCRTSAH